MSLYGNPLIRFCSRLHWGVIILVVILCLIGLLMQYSAAGGSLTPWAQSQFLRFVPGLALMLIIAAVPIRWLLQYAPLAYGCGVLLLVIVEVAGHIGMGAQRWISIGGINLQPSEFMKLAVILMLARHFDKRSLYEKPWPQYLIVPLILVAIPAALILKQPNLGTATIICAISAIILFAAGLRWVYVVAVGGVIAAAAPIAWQFLHDYQKQRVLTFLNPESDPLGAGYNIIQSIIAIGSGGLTGRGFLKGSQGQLDFLPEKQTDFIFTMLAEEFGFIGAFGTLMLYSLLLAMMLGIAVRSRNRFGALVCIGVAAMLFLHLFINIGMSMGLLPVVGVPLPFLSYGGTMMLASLMACGLVLNVWAHRDNVNARQG